MNPASKDYGLAIAARFFAGRRGHGQTPGVVYVQMRRLRLASLLAVAHEEGWRSAQRPVKADSIGGGA